MTGCTAPRTASSIQSWVTRLFFLHEALAELGGHAEGFWYIPWPTQASRQRALLAYHVIGLAYMS